MNYLNKHPNKEFGQMNLIEMGVQKTVKIDFNKFICNIGFRNTLREAFFSHTKNHIRFKKSLTYAQLKKQGFTPQQIVNDAKEYIEDRENRKKKRRKIFSKNKTDITQS
ncbi:hypothetical protein HOH45_03015 [bacterium]|nr:hypothetical protein [bacterium]